MADNSQKMTIEIEELVHETDAAWLFRIEGAEHWLPKSQCHYDEGVDAVEVPEWLLKAKGIV